MKCICGYEEPEDQEEQVEVFFQSGKRKGELKEVKTILHEVDQKDKFIKLGVEKGFSFQAQDKSWCGAGWAYVNLFACPKCHTVKMVV